MLSTESEWAELREELFEAMRTNKNFYACEDLVALVMAEDSSKPLERRVR
jgi:hypothetical protein